MTTPTPTTTAAPAGFMTHLGQLEVKAEQEGIKLFHAAHNWFDHITWSQVASLLLPAIKAVNPGILAGVEAVAGAVEGATMKAAPATTTDSPDQSFEDWAKAQLQKAALGLADLQSVVDEQGKRLDELTADQAPAGDVVPPADPAIPPAAGEDVPLPAATD